ncbi:MAG: 30S ribosomal protein S13, partial [Flavobacteriia bacterium]|nr:30S ribosomal protein S13 [Candidatus Bostrichicola ureolyticus]
MARISGIDLSKNKRGIIALTEIYGIGKSTATKILNINNIDKNIKVKYWTNEQINNIREYISNTLKVEGELRSEIQLNIKRLIDIGCYRGIRHRIGLPVRGQK